MSIPGGARGEWRGGMERSKEQVHPRSAQLFFCPKTDGTGTGPGGCRQEDTAQLEHGRCHAPLRRGAGGAHLPDRQTDPLAQLRVRPCIHSTPSFCFLFLACLGRVPPLCTPVLACTRAHVFAYTHFFRVGVYMYTYVYIYTLILFSFVEDVVLEGR